MSDSVPPGVSPANAARRYFTAAVNHLTHRPKPIKRTYEGVATEIEMLCANFVYALKQGAPLKEIDSLAAQMGSKVLEVQSLTIKARKDGVE